MGLFTNQTNDWAVSHNAYGMSNGIWQRYLNTAERYRAAFPRGMRALFCLNEPTGVGNYPMVYTYAAGPGLFDEFSIDEYDTDSDFSNYVTDVVLHTIDANGNHEYYDLQGRKLPGRPTTSGVYIHNGKKIINK